MTGEARIKGLAGAHASWARTADRSARTEPARKAALERFEREVDPDGALDPADRAIRAEHARKAYFAKLALKSAVSRRKAREHAEAAAAAEAELAAEDGGAA